MADESIFEKAEAALRRNWEVHHQAFGPILEPAFSENPQARLLLINALNHISNKQMEPGRAILKQLNEMCSCNADRAALAYFTGLTYEMTGVLPQMIKWYETADRFGHRFFLPHMKLAKAYHNAAIYDNARKHYETAIDYLKAMDDPDPEILASGYTNLTSCLTMMHLHTDAKKAWAQAQHYPLQPGAYAAAVMMYAAAGDKEQTATYLQTLEEKFPAWFDKTRQVAQLVLNRAHPHFHQVAVDDDLLDAFWLWFRENEELLRSDVPKALPQLARRLKATFPFLHREPNLHLAKNAQGMKLTLHDFYAVGLHYGFGKLLKKCPEDILSRWAFTIMH